MTDGISRREFCGMAAFSAVGCALPTFGAPVMKRWYKGMLHCHSYWSDGRAFPDDVAAIYRDMGYNFLSITDHNRMALWTDNWRKVVADEGGWPPAVIQSVYDHYVKKFPWAETRTGKDGKTEVRLLTVKDVQKHLEERERFMLMPGVELTRSMVAGEHSHDVHMNYINVPEVIPDVVNDWMISRRPGMTVQVIAKHDFREYSDLVMKHGNPPSLFMINHPHLCFLDTTAADFIALPQIRFFEVCNGGAGTEVPKEIADDGWENDRLWDVVNAFRARRGQALLYALGSDDSHWYPGNGHWQKPHAMYTPGDAWISVRASALTPADVIEAMNAGDFYASCGVTLEDVSFEKGTLSVSVPAKPGVAYRIRFIVSKKNFDEKPLRTIELFWTERRRSVLVYGPDVGGTAKSVEGKPGAALSASYTLADDDLYVRARIESDEPSILKEQAFHPKTKCAWTQPYTCC